MEPRFIIKLNRELDFEVSHEFLGLFGALDINGQHISSVQELKSIFKCYYDDNNDILQSKVTWLHEQGSRLRQISGCISKLVGYEWGNIDKITISPALCPLAPRFIDQSAFMVPFYAQDDWIVRVCAHEMTHFLYFDKLANALGRKVATEQPSLDWLLSEIVAPSVVNKSPIQSIVHNRDSFFSPTEQAVSRNDISYIQKLFFEEPDIQKFRNQALEILKKDEKKISG